MTSQTSETTVSSSRLSGAGQDMELMPLALQRMHHTICLPPCFQEDIPQPLASLPLPLPYVPEDANQTLARVIEEPMPSPRLPVPKPSTSRTRMCRLNSPHNTFQVFWHYYAEEFPSHNPDEGLLLAHFSDIDTSPYAPYPNKSSFLLRKWFWRDGVQKSWNDFNALLQVLKDPDFSLDDIWEMQWHSLNKRLGDSDKSKVPSSNVDTGWIQEFISLMIPFHRQMASSRNKIFEAGTFHHQSIVLVIREPLAGADGHHFHYEPYELHWQLRLKDLPIWGFGELYTSLEFHCIHQELQNSPPEPGCDLPSIVVGLMFTSDATQFTQFSDAKLWPIYLFFGNDPKYQQCKPSCHLCNYIAYLQTVCPFPISK